MQLKWSVPEYRNVLIPRLGGLHTSLNFLKVIGQHNARFWIVDDLTQEDLREKNRVRPFMDELYKRQQRPSFRNGSLYADGKEVALDVINAFLNHSGPV